MRLTIVSLLNLIGFVHLCANHFLFIFIQLMASCLVSLSIDLAWEGRSLTSWIVLNSMLYAGLFVCVYDSSHPRWWIQLTTAKTVRNFTSHLVFFTYHHSDVCVYGLSLIHPPIQKRKSLSWGLWRIYHLPNAVQRWRSWAWKRHSLAFGDDGYMTGPRMDSASILEVKWFLW